MKKMNKGFSLAEILIALGIISVIATMGFSIAKKGIDRAYDYYFYTGYQGLLSATVAANADGVKFGKNEVGNQSDINMSFIHYITDVLNCKHPEEYLEGNNKYILEHPNGIKYTFEQHGNRLSGNNYRYNITMQVPCRKQKKNDNTFNNIKVKLAYISNAFDGTIIPISPSALEIQSGEYIDLLDRIDLLAFYIDDGSVGRFDIEGNYVKRRFGNANQAICHRYGNNAALLRNHLNITCSQQSMPEGTPETGVMKVADPRKN